jgi:hypothetical protein
MRYHLTPLTEGLAKRLSGDCNLQDEIALCRITVQDLVTRLDECSHAGERIAVGSLLRDALEMLSRLVERAARLPVSATALSANQVHTMLKALEKAVLEHLPDGTGRQQLIMTLNEQLSGISTREEPSAAILRTCEMMDRSVPYVNASEDLGTAEASSAAITSLVHRP